MELLINSNYLWQLVDMPKKQQLVAVSLIQNMNKYNHINIPLYMFAETNNIERNTAGLAIKYLIKNDMAVKLPKIFMLNPQFVRYIDGDFPTLKELYSKLRIQFKKHIISNRYKYQCLI